MSTELRRIGLKGLLASVAIAGMTTGLATAQISANENASVPQMENLLEGQGIDVTNLQVAAGANQQYGSFSNGLGTVNIDSGVYISTGQGANFAQIATNQSDITNNGNTPDSDLTVLRSTATNDTAALQMTVTPAANTIKARMVFASEEYPEFVCSDFNDAFGLFVSGPGVSGTMNFAQVPGSNTDISINTVNNGLNNDGQVCAGETSNNSSLYNDNPSGASFIFDGYTDAIEVTMYGVTPGEDYVFKMAVADAIDTFYDSAVFVDFLESVWEHTADLSLDLTASTQAPVIGQNFTITATINNAGPDEVPFFKVADILPAGLTFVSASGDGAYDDTNDEWSSTASIAANGTMTMTLTVFATATETYTTASEVIEQWSDDLDSTPNDGEGDDYDTIFVTVGPPPVTPQPLSLCVPGTALYEESFDDGTNAGWVSTQSQNPPTAYSDATNNINNDYGTRTDVTIVSTLNGGRGVASPSGGGFVGAYDRAGGAPLWSSNNLSGTDMSDALGGVLYFERFNYASSSPNFDNQPQDFYIVGTSGRLVLDIATPSSVLATGAWATIERKLEPSAEWFYVPNTDISNQSGRSSATAADFASVLSSVNLVGVTAEYINGRDLQGFAGLITPVDESNAHRIERYALDTVKIMSCQVDRSDAPSVYDEAVHRFAPGLQLGAQWDAEAAIIANSDASGDGADDDGVFANAGLSTGLQGEAFQQEDGSILYVPVVGTGALYAWADWDQDGTFGNNANEIIANGTTGTDETLVVPFSVPLTALNGQTFMRFRWSSDVAAASPTGLAADGEVEDYAVIIGGSVTPAPTPGSCSAGFLTQSWAASGGGYASTTSDGLIVTANASAAAGASWSFAPNDALNSAGEFGDPSINGITSLSTVYSWDTTPEDGRNANASDDAQPGQLSFSFSEYVRDPIFYIDRVGGYGGSEAATPQALSNSILITSNSLPLTRLAGVDHLEVTNSTVRRTPNETMIFGEGTSESGTDRTRNTAMGAVQVTGTFDTVEFDVTGIGVEGAGGDGLEFVWCAQLAEDYQDAPAIYGVASHVYDPNVRLGVGLDADAGSLASVDATGDGGDDDGVTLPTLTHGLASTISVDVTGAGYLQAWIDFDGNNSFGGSGEQIATDVQDGGAGDTDGVANGTIVLSVTPPANGFTGTSFARFRWSTDTGLGSTGAASDGEVEDYAVTIRDLDELAFTPDQRRTVIPGTAVLYPHTLYVPEDLSGGTLAFAQTSDQSLNWTIWRDVDASGDLSAADVQWVNGAALPATGELGFIVQAQVAGTVPAGWRDISEFTATVTLGAQTRSNSVTDVTDVSGLDAGTLTAAKFLAIDSDCDGTLTDETASDAAFEIGKQGLPGTCVVYRITFRNDSTAAVTEVVVRDMVPAWTTYVAGSANYETVPSGMTAGTATTPTAGQRGALAFPFTGSLAAGADGAVSYEVKIDE